MSTHTVTFVAVTCCGCGVVFGLSEDHHGSLQSSHRDFNCPNGHALAFNGPSREERLKRQLADTSRQLANTQWELQLTERSRRAYKGQLTKTRRRVANGVCPCCNRTFADLAAHMHTKHPEYGDGEP